jgi:hypothetical protein
MVCSVEGSNLILKFFRIQNYHTGLWHWAIVYQHSKWTSRGTLAEVSIFVTENTRFLLDYGYILFICPLHTPKQMDSVLPIERWRVWSTCGLLNVHNSAWPSCASYDLVSLRHCMLIRPRFTRMFRRMDWRSTWDSIRAHRVVDSTDGREVVMYR